MKFGTKQDIALACVYMASSAAQYITGDTLVVDGGQWLYKLGWGSGAVCHCALGVVHALHVPAASL